MEDFRHIAYSWDEEFGSSHPHAYPNLGQSIISLYSQELDEVWTTEYIRRCFLRHSTMKGHVPVFPHTLLSECLKDVQFS
jgi:hypothetical protein